MGTSTTEDSSTTDGYRRKTALIVFLWLVAMFIGGVLLIRYGSVLQSLFA